jgi:hypothetical protein
MQGHARRRNRHAQAFLRSQHAQIAWSACRRPARHGDYSISQAVLAYGGSIEYFRETVFNQPTFEEAYKVAALDGVKKL